MELTHSAGRRSRKDIRLKEQAAAIQRATKPKSPDCIQRGVTKKRKVGDVPPILEALRAPDLRFLCGFFRLSRGGSKTDLIEELLTSPYDGKDILRTAAEIRFGGRIADLLPKAEIREVLSANGLPITGSRKELVFRLVENRLFDAKALLGLLTHAGLKELYYAIFNRIPTDARVQVIDQILTSAQLAPEGAAQEFVRPSREEFEYDVAISFAGEDREVAKEIAEGLTKSGIQVFFDLFYQAQLWGKDLAIEFQKRYGPKTRFVMPLISGHYAIKDWTDYEFTIARQEALVRGHEFILPVRLDDTPLAGLKSTIAYLDLKHEGVDGVVANVLEKLDRKPYAQPARGSQSASAGPRPVPAARLDFFFRRHKARIERFPVSWVNPATLHQVEINAELRYDGKGELHTALIKLALDARLASGSASPNLPFRDLEIQLEGRKVPVKYLQLPWKGHGGLPLFKAASQRLFDKDMPIFFMKEWVESQQPPFIRWEILAPDLEPSRGSLLVRRDKEDLILEPASVPNLGDFLQDGRGRAVLTKPDLSFGAESGA